MEKKTYHHVCFRIEAGYVWGEGMSKEAFDIFINEVILLFARMKWTVAPVFVGDCVHLIKGKTRLYVHPMELSGPCEDGLIPEVEAILAKGRSFSHYRTDRYDELLDLEGDDLMAAYRKKNDSAEAIILKHFAKPKKKECVPCDLFELANKVRIRTLDDYIGRSTGDPADVYMKEVYDSLVSRGLIVTDGSRVMSAC